LQKGSESCPFFMPFSIPVKKQICRIYILPDGGGSKRINVLYLYFATGKAKHKAHTVYK
jgi:hypothetical protein